MKYRELWEVTTRDQSLRAPHTVYLRLGSLPPDQRSRIGAAPNHIKAMFQTSDHEEGVSVYEVEWNAKLQRWMIDAGNHASLDELFAQNRPAYLVTGRPAKKHGEWLTGMDGEPLLRSVKIIEQLPYDKLYVPGWGADGFPEEYLEPDEA